jgi:hypothetical protein
VHQPADACAPGSVNEGANLQTALDAAAATGGVDDEVDIGAGTYSGPFSYTATTSAVTIKGVGNGTVLTAVPASGLTVLNLSDAGSRVENLEIDLPAGNSGAQNVGLSTEGTAEGLKVTVPTPVGAGAPLEGVLLLNGGSFVNGTVLGPITSQPSSVVAVGGGGQATIARSTLQAAEAVQVSGGGTISRVNATGHTGFFLQSETSTGGDGHFVVEDSLWRPGSGNTQGFGLFAGCGFSADLQVTARNLTLDNTTTDGAAAESICAVTGRSANVDLGSSIAVGGANSLLANTVSAPTATATLGVAYSDYDPTTVDEIGMGTSSVNQGTGNVNTSPGFVDLAGGDFHLTSGSPVIDLGDPASPSAGETDLDGNARSLDGPDADCTARRDVGAYEFVQAGSQDCTPAVPPSTTPTPTTPTPKKKCKKKHKRSAAAAKKCKKKKR